MQYSNKSYCLILAVVALFMCSCSQKKVIREYHPNGQLKMEYEIEDGKSNGFKKEYHSNGQLRFEGTKVNGISEGTFKFFYENGKLEIEGTYKNDKVEGLVKNYYENNILKSTHEFVDGHETGETKYFNPDGSLEKIALFEKDTFIFYEKYDSTGKVIDEYRKFNVEAISSTDLLVGDTIQVKLSYTGPATSDTFLISTLVVNTPGRDIQLSKSFFIQNKNYYTYKYIPRKEGSYHFLGYLEFKNFEKNLPMLIFRVKKDESPASASL